MIVSLCDRAPLEKVRRLADGRIAAVAKFARSGVYQYSGSEVGRPDLSSVNVYRPADEVFDHAAMASFAHKAITVGHPANGEVTADNWKQHSAGYTEGKVARDGDFIEIPLMLADASAVQAYDSGTARELSAGYSCDLVWGDGVAPDGTRYQATQRTIRGNHIALVAQGRAGSRARIGDSMNTTNDAAMQDVAIATAVARDRMAHEQRFAFLGDGAPPFDAARSEFLARQACVSDATRAARDVFLAAKYSPATSAPATAGLADAPDPSFMHADAASTNAALRAARYA